MKYIAVSFTLKDQDFKKIAKSLEELVSTFDQTPLLIHGFMPREIVEEKGYSTDVVDLLDRLFPNKQLNVYDSDLVKMRLDLAQFVRYFKADVYIIGDVYAGVSDEVALYEGISAKLNYISLN